ncbi:MAG: homoserine dehydrogenase [Caldilineales bacterium]|nr:homoserine dehydrogenase [Caldilineales bacterium]MDW8317943.1 homoserine dehydrogenase [Anaerolineae bacterium]
MSAPRTVDLILVGLGHVHRQLLHLLATRSGALEERYGLRLRVVGACDSRGAVVSAAGLNPAMLLCHKLSGAHAGEFAGGQPGATALDLLRQVRADVLLEASPVNLRDGEPALTFVRAAIEAGLDVVLANKAPLALAYADLHRRARERGVRLAFSATVCGGLPVVNVGTRDLVAAQVRRVEGIFNSTSNYILTQMAAGQPYHEALAEAQRRGIAEADPSLDVDGWDTANKLTIVANAVLGFPATVADVQPVAGIHSAEGSAGARSPASVLKLLGTAERRPDGGYHLSVRPVWLPPEHKLAHVNGWEMGVVFETDLFETLFIAIDERGPIGTAAAVLRDVVNLYR